MMMFPERLKYQTWSSDKDFLKYLEELNNQTKLNISDTWIIMLSSGEFTDIFEDYEKKLGDIEDRYFRFLDYRLVDSLMEIRWNLLSLTVDSNCFKSIHKASEKIAEETMRESSEAFAECIQQIFKEVYKMHKLGIEIRTTQTLLERQAVKEKYRS